MKKLSVICMTILAVFAMASCRGPQGPAGHDGHDGHDGNDANVSSSTVTVKSSDWEWNDYNGQWVVTIDYAAINSNVYNYGAVLVYMDVDGAWSQVPLTYYYQFSQINDQGETEILIPLIDPVIQQVDREAKTIFITAPTGLIDLYLEQ